jgi:hypothetical protein
MQQMGVTLFLNEEDAAKYATLSKDRISYLKNYIN